MNVKKSKVGLLGGSFNPPHLGHVGIVRYLLNQKKVDAIWVIPCLEHPFDKALVPFEHCFKMCGLAFEEFGDKIGVKDVEKKLGGKSYTLRTVEHLQKEFPEIDFVLIVGEDAAKESATWKSIEVLKKKIPWLIVSRGPQSPILNVSATEIRQALQKRSGLVTLLSQPVINYIAANKLY